MSPTMWLISLLTLDAIAIAVSFAGLSTCRQPMLRIKRQIVIMAIVFILLFVLALVKMSMLNVNSQQLSFNQKVFFLILACLGMSVLASRAFQLVVYGSDRSSEL